MRAGVNRLVAENEKILQGDGFKASEKGKARCSE